MRYDASEVGAQTMGHVVENTRLQAACIAAAQGSGGAVDMRWPASVTALRLPPYSSAAGTGVLARGQHNLARASFVLLKNLGADRHMEVLAPRNGTPLCALEKWLPGFRKRSPGCGGT